MISDINADQIRFSQISDPTLARIRTACDEKVIKGNAKYFKKQTLYIDSIVPLRWKMVGNLCSL